MAVVAASRNDAARLAERIRGVARLLRNTRLLGTAAELMDLAAEVERLGASSPAGSQEARHVADAATISINKQDRS